jgi:transposase
VTAGISGVLSPARVHAPEIEEALEAGLTAQRIWQDLVAEKGFGGSYQSVKRFVRRLKGADPQRIWRMECLPGEEAQVDFGSGYWLVDEHGRKRKTHIFRITLSFSRKSYSEAVLRQDTETFLRCLENAFRYFGGVPATLNLDNLKAAVIHADWYDPELNPKLLEFACHYGTAIVPTRPRKPEHKGKIESAIKYVKNNALRGRTFSSLAALNEFLRYWESSIADLRIHGTTRQQVARRFAEQEKSVLKPLADSLFPCYREGQRQVHRDSFVEVDRAYYHVPCEYISRVVWVRWDARMVRVFNARMEPVASHVHLPAGTFSAVLGAQGRPCVTLEESQSYWGDRAQRLGSHVRAWAEAIFEQRGPIGLRVVQGLVALSRNHPSRDIDQACAQALSSGQWRLRELRALLQQPSVSAPSFSFLESHPLIRDMDAYGALVGPFEENPPTPFNIQTA